MNGFCTEFRRNQPDRRCKLTDSALVLIAALSPICVVTTIWLGISPLSAQDVPPPNRGGFTSSMGVPPTWRWSLGFSARTHRRPDEDAQVGLYGTGGFYKDITR